MLEFFWNLISFVVVLGILITAHEYGHFWVARKNGVKVERFSIGFGKVLWRKYDRHGTEFVVAALPLGGYVKMLDTRVDDVAEADIDKTFNSKSVYQRIAIIAAGPVANFIVAIFAFYLMFLIGVPSVKPIIGKITEHSVAAKANLSEESEIIAISGKKTLDWQDVSLALVSSIGDDTIHIMVREKNRASTRNIVLDTQGITFSPDKEPLITTLGIAPYRAKVFTELARIAKGSPAEKAGLKVGDKLIALQSQPLNDNWHVFADGIKQYANQTVEIEVERSGQRLNLEVTPGEIERAGKSIGYLGISPKSDAYPSQYLFDLNYGPIEAVEQSLLRTWQLVVLSFDMIGKLITGDVSVKNLSGPISIAQGAGNSANFGFVHFLGFLALISINLGIINLLPLPVLDGGHLFYYIIEVITGKPVPEKIQEVGFKFGSIALLALMSIAIFNDLSRL